MNVIPDRSKWNPHSSTSLRSLNAREKNFKSLCARTLPDNRTSEHLLFSFSFFSGHEKIEASLIPFCPLNDSNLINVLPEVFANSSIHISSRNGAAKKTTSRALRKRNVSLATHYAWFLKLLMAIHSTITNESDTEPVLVFMCFIWLHQMRLLSEDLMDRKPSFPGDLETVENETPDVVE